MKGSCRVVLCRCCLLRLTSYLEVSFGSVIVPPFCNSLRRSKERRARERRGRKPKARFQKNKPTLVLSGRSLFLCFWGVACSHPFNSLWMSDWGYRLTHGFKICLYLSCLKWLFFFRQFAVSFKRQKMINLKWSSEVVNSYLTPKYQSWDLKIWTPEHSFSLLSVNLVVPRWVFSNLTAMRS